MKNPQSKHYWSIAVYAFLVIAAAILFVFLVSAARDFLSSKQFSGALDTASPFIYGLAFAYLLNPIMVFFERTVFGRIKRRHTLKRNLSILLAYIAAVVGISLIMLMVIPQVGASINQLTAKITDLFTIVDDVEAFKSSDDFTNMLRLNKARPEETDNAAANNTTDAEGPTTDGINGEEGADSYLVFDPDNNVFHYENPIDVSGEMVSYERLMNTKIGIYITEAAASLQEIVSEMGLNIDIEQGVRDTFLSFTANITVFISQYFATIFNTTASILYSAARQLLNVIIGIIISFYVLVDKERLARQVKKVLYAFLPTLFARRSLEVVRKSHAIVGGFISGKLLDSLIIGILCFICMSIFKINYPMLISVIIGITNIIPFFGPFIGAIPCIFFLIINDMGQGVWFMVFILILQQVDGNIIGPKILGSTLGLSSFWVIFAILIMNGLFGLFGMFLGVPVFTVVYTLVKDYANARLCKKDSTGVHDCVAVEPPPDTMPAETGLFHRAALLVKRVADDLTQRLNKIRRD